MANDIAQQITALTELAKGIPESLLAAVDDPNSPGKKTKKLGFGTFLKTYNISAGEIAALLSNDDLDFSFNHGNIKRTGATLNGTTPDTIAMQAAVNANSEVYIPEGTPLITSAIALRQGMKIRGDGRFRSIILVSGAINGFTFTGVSGNPDGGSMAFEDFTIKGSSLSLDLVELTTAGQNEFSRMKFWLSGASMVKLLTECHNTSFNDCLFQSFKTAGVFYSGLNSIQALRNCEFSIVGADGIIPTAGTSTCVRVDIGEQLTIAECNVNGDTTLGALLTTNGSGVGRIIVEQTFVERITAPAISSSATTLIDGMLVQGCNFSTTNSVRIDLSAGSQVHTGIIVRNIRTPETGAVFVFDPGSAADFDYNGITLDGSADHVVGFAGFRHVTRKFGATITHLDGRTKESVGPFTQENVAASQTDVALSGTRWIATRPGRVVGVVVKSTEARTAGTCTIAVIKNTGLSGVAGSGVGLTAVLDATNTSSKASTSDSVDSAFRFVAGDEIYPNVTTDAGWLPTTADIRVWLEIES